MAELTVQQLQALHAAARWPLSDAFDGSVFGAYMRKRAGPRWRAQLERALAEVSRELATAIFQKAMRR